MAISMRTLQGSTRLVFDSVEGITGAVEAMHETIARLPAPLSPRPARPTAAHGAIAAAVYATIRGTNDTLREGADLLFNVLPQSKDTPSQPSTEARTIAAINGVFGDHLESTDNTLAIAMSLHANGEQLELNRESLTTAIPAASPNLVVLVHGLCLSEQCWHRNGTSSLGEKLHNEFACTPLYLRYNSGRHISSNGQEFAQLLEQLVEAWPVPVETLSLIGHSMGGLVIRSAGWYANQQSHSWLGKLKRVVCLGSPHHGSMPPSPTPPTH